MPVAAITGSRCPSRQAGQDYAAWTELTRTIRFILLYGKGGERQGEWV